MDGNVALLLTFLKVVQPADASATEAGSRD